MMKYIAILLLSAAVSLSAETYKAADKCSAKNCKREDGCVSASGVSSIEKSKTPQFILLSFDESVNNATYHQYYKALLDGRKNPDNSTIKATFFVPHEYTDYEAVHKLYVSGHEIGTHSISKNGSAEYWAKASKSTLVEEFNGQIKILTKFASIPKRHIVGARTPHFQLNADVTFKAYNESGITYDNSWAALSALRLFPYNLNCSSGQQCLVGTCPTESYPNIWISPINNILGKNDQQCNSILGCNFNGTKAEVKTWLYNQFMSHYNGTRTPMSLLLSSAWFGTIETGFDGLQEFIDEVLKNKNVFFVTNSQLLAWQKAPVEVAKYKTVNDVRKNKCKPITCELKKDDGTRYMRSCVACPKQYPWIGNPEGKQ